MRFRAIILLSCILYIVSLVIVIRDTNFSQRWIAFFYWMAAIFVYLSQFFIPKLREIVANIRLKLKEKRITFSTLKTHATRAKSISIIMIFLVFAISLFAINVYPFHAVGDELRDGALNAAQIVKGEIRNIFSYGRYESHGLIIPEYSALFYLVMGNNPLMHRLAAVTIGIASCILLYFWTKKYLSQTNAVISTLILLFMPLYLYYSRTEVVVIFSLFWMVVILWLVSIYLSNPSTKILGLVSMVLGFAAGFHGSTRTIVLLTILLMGIWTLVNSVKQKKFFKLLVLFIVAGTMFAVGFGPRVYFTDFKNAVMESRFFFSKSDTDDDLTLKENATKTEKAVFVAKKVALSGEKLYINYVRSFFAYFYEPTTTHFDCDSILGVIIGLFFIYGLFELCSNPERPRWVLVYYTLLIPLTNSALTEVINGDHRLAPAFAIAAIVAGYGIVQLYNRLELLKIERFKSFSRRFLIVFVIVTVVSRGIGFFTSQQASYGMFLVDDGKLYQDFMITYAMREIKAARVDRYGKICIYSNVANSKYLDKIHIKEQFAYYLPGLKVKLEKVPTLPDHEWYIDNTCAYTETLEKNQRNKYSDINNKKLWKSKQYCKYHDIFICPPDKSSFTIKYRTKLEGE